MQPLHTVGQGCPDLLVGYRGLNILIEVKDGKLSPSRQKLTQDEHDWMMGWRGQYAGARSLDDQKGILDGDDVAKPKP